MEFEAAKPGRDAWALAFAMLFPTVMAWAYFVALARSPDTSRPTEPNPIVQAAYGLGKFVQFCFPVVYLAWREPHCLRPRMPSVAGLSWGLGFGLLVAIATLLLYRFGLAEMLLEMGTRDRIREKVEEFHADTPGRFIALALFLSVVHSLLEEYYWRWFVFGRLRRLVPLAAAVAVSSLAFMAHHVIILYVLMPRHFLTVAVPLSLSVAAGGAVWAWLYERSGAIYAPWLSHLLVDAAIMAVGYDLLFGT